MTWLHQIAGKYANGFFYLVIEDLKPPITHCALEFLKEYCEHDKKLATYQLYR